jgi:hypothetical protein
VVRELPIGLGWMLHIFLNWGVAVAWRFAEHVLDGLATVWCWLAWVVSTNGAFPCLCETMESLLLITTLALV